MQENQRSERRQLSRWQISLPTKVKFGGAVNFADCTIRDLSFKGMQMCMKLRLPKDVFSKLSVVLSKEIVLEVEVWVAWHKAVDGYNIYGLYFSKIEDTEKAKIYRFVCSNFSEQISSKLGNKSIEQGNEGRQDCRIFARIPAEFPVRYLNPKDNNEGFAQARDIGAKGLGLVTKERLEPNTHLELWLEAQEEEKSLYMRGEVIWSKQLKPGLWTVGINLEKADLMGLARLLKAI